MRKLVAKLSLSVVASGILAAATAVAHEGHGEHHSFLSGIVHPFTGVDHIALLLLGAGALLLSMVLRRSGQKIAQGAVLAVIGLMTIHALSHGGLGLFSIGLAMATVGGSLGVYHLAMSLSGRTILSRIAAGAVACVGLGAAFAA